MLTIYTLAMGKISVKASGVRRITSRRSSHIELLNDAELSLYKKSYIPILTEVETINNFSEIKNNLEKTGFAYHICELIDGLCPEGEVQPEIFHLLKSTLNEICMEKGKGLLLAIHSFEVQLLTLLGFWHRGSQSSLEFDTRQFIESILEHKLRSQYIFSKVS